MGRGMGQGLQQGQNPSMNPGVQTPGGPGPSDGSLYQEVLGTGTFSISDPQVGSPGHQGRSSSAQPSLREQSTSTVPNNVFALRPADPDYQNNSDSGTPKRHATTFQCTLCPKRFTREYNLRSHLRTHTDERPFVCTVCGKAFARQHDRRRHESLHSGEKKFVCQGDLKVGGRWGCGRRFTRADALGRHFRSEAGRICIKPLLDEEMKERQRLWKDQRMQHNTAQNMGTHVYPVDATGNYMLPAALLAQYPALTQMNWSDSDGSGSGMISSALESQATPPPPAPGQWDYQRQLGNEYLEERSRGANLQAKAKDPQSAESEISSTSTRTPPPNLTPTSIPYTISQDHTAGEETRRLGLLADFGRKGQRSLTTLTKSKESRAKPPSSSKTLGFGNSAFPSTRVRGGR
ncbi:hypothetical protein AUP68_12405 [Ilyonectria robusta]